MRQIAPASLVRCVGRILNRWMMSLNTVDCITIEVDVAGYKWTWYIFPANLVNVYSVGRDW